MTLLRRYSLQFDARLLEGDLPSSLRRAFPDFFPTILASPKVATRKLNCVTVLGGNGQRKAKDVNLESRLYFIADNIYNFVSRTSDVR